MACEKSLERLCTDHIDYYQLHNPRIEAIRCDVLFEAPGELRDAGKIRAFGVALGPAIAERQISESIAVIEVRGAHIQIIYNLLEHMIGAPVFPTARRRQCGVFTQLPHSSGLLEGVYTEGTAFSNDDHRGFRATDDKKRKA